MQVLRNINNQLINSTIRVEGFYPQKGRKPNSPLVGFIDVYIDDIGIRSWPVFENPVSHRQWIAQPHSSFVTPEEEIGYKQLTDIPAELLSKIKEAVLVAYSQWKLQQLKEPDWLTKPARRKYA